jgi:hypothetical protein
MGGTGLKYDTPVKRIILSDSRIKVIFRYLSTAQLGIVLLAPVAAVDTCIVDS